MTWTNLAHTVSTLEVEPKTERKPTKTKNRRWWRTNEHKKDTYILSSGEVVTIEMAAKDTRNKYRLPTGEIAHRLAAGERSVERLWREADRVKPTMKKYRLTTGEELTAVEAHQDPRNVNERALSTIRARLCTGKTRPETLWR